MKHITYLILTALLTGLLSVSAVNANEHCPKRGEISLRSTGAGISSLIIPGVGQFINDQPKGKVVTHAVAGFVLPGVIHLFSAYDALFDREGGYWKGRI